MNWYLVDGNYIDYLKSFDNKVGNVNYGSAIKPYIGVVFKMNGTNNNYFIYNWNIKFFRDYNLH